MLKIFMRDNLLKFPRGGRGPQGGAVFSREIPTAFARGPSRSAKTRQKCSHPHAEDF